MLIRGPMTRGELYQLWDAGTPGQKQKCDRVILTMLSNSDVRFDASYRYEITDQARREVQSQEGNLP